MRKDLLSAALILSMLGGLACNRPSAPAGTAREADQIKVLTLGTHGVGSVVNTLGSGVASVLNKRLAAEVKVVASSGPTEWLPMIQSEEIDLGILNSWDAEMGRRGESVYGQLSGKRGFPILLITSGHKALNGMVVAENSGIRTAPDLKGKRFVGAFTGTPGVTAQAEAALANLGLSLQDVRMVAVPSVDAAIRAVIEGRADIAGSANVGMGIVSELDAGKGARFLSFDPSPEALQRLQDKFPATLVKVSPGPGKTGVRGDAYLMSYDFYLVGRQNLPEDLVYDIVRILWEDNQSLVGINTQLQDWIPENFVTPVNTVPYHPGAVRFYREQGRWTPEMETRQQRLLAGQPG